ncbi:MAG: SGNH/GDSL hydrolase family protein [Armatimonadota bacterium]|nr:SGNH/GDSL hydrolase family protein [Armatimonadota bacterium]
MLPIFEKNALVLFQGDSITDAGRNREAHEDLGRGYAMMAAAWFSAMYPELGVRFLNRGISGNTVLDLKARWKEDCIDLKPTWVSIMIGINDAARRYTQDKPMPHEVYENTYREILTQAKEQLGAKFILLEPFVLPIPEDRIRWREDLNPKIEIVRNLAREFGAILVPMDGIFAQAAAKRDLAFWAPDGVHPTPAGHALMAREWLQAVKAL